MTKQEVIKILSLIKSTVFLGNRKFLDALDCAIELLAQPEPSMEECACCVLLCTQRKKGKWIPVTRIEKWHKEEGLVGFPPEVKEFPQCTIEWVDATEPDEVDGLRCSECGTVYDFTEARNWCSECGAKMEGQAE